MATFQREMLSQAQKDIEGLLEEYEDELPLPFKLRPDWDQYAALELAGNLVIATARENDKLLGYFALILSPNINSAGETLAFGATLFLRKNCRKGMVGVRLIRHGESLAKFAGADCIMISSQVIQPIDRLLYLLKYKPTEMIFVKRV